MPDFTMTPEARDLRKRVRDFMDEHIYPNEPFFMDEHADSGKRAELMKDLQARTKAMGMWAPHLPSEAGGMGIGFMPYVYMNEILGRSPVAPLRVRLRRRRTPATPRSSSSSAPRSRRSSWHEAARHRRHPLLLLDDRAGGLRRRPDRPPDARRPRRRRVGDQRPQVVHAAAPSAPSFAIVMCVTRPGRAAAPPHDRRSSCPPTRPASSIVRAVPVMGETAGNHCEICYRDVRVPVTNMLGEPGRRLPDRAEAPRAGAHPPLHALAGPDAARLRAACASYALERAGVRQHAGGEADRAELDRRLGRRRSRRRGC